MPPSAELLTESHDRRRRILGARVDDLDRPETLARIEALALSDGAAQVVTPNPELVMLARRDPDFRAVLERAALAPADGVGLRWAGRLLGQPIRAVVPGSELIEALAPAAAARGARWFLLGAAEGVAEEVGRTLEARYPGLVIAGTFAGSPSEGDASEILTLIEATAPLDMLFVAYGSPAQELWIDRNRQALPVRVAIGIGGGFNFIAGRSRRPPAWVKRVGLIWLFRLLTEPWRWRRQLSLLRFSLLVLRRSLRSARDT